MPGEAEGVLVGGNLTVLATSAGTPLTHGAADSIAVLEDVGEEPYRLDRSLTQLLRSGWFAGVRGVVLGQFTDCGRDPAVVRDLLAKPTLFHTAYARAHWEAPARANVTRELAGLDAVSRGS